MRYSVLPILLITVLITGCGTEDTKTIAPPATTSTESSSNPEIAAAAKEVLAGDAILIDVREQGEWDEAHFDGAILIPMSKLRADEAILASTPGVDKSKKIYTHCAAGKRAATAADILKENGYDVEALTFSFDELSENGFAVSEPKN